MFDVYFSQTEKKATVCDEYDAKPSGYEWVSTHQSREEAQVAKSQLQGDLPWVVVSGAGRWLEGLRINTREGLDPTITVVAEYATHQEAVAYRAGWEAAQ